MAFDSVYHATLALKLQAADLSRNSFDHIIDYLSNREQYIDIKGAYKRNVSNMGCRKANR